MMEYLRDNFPYIFTILIIPFVKDIPGWMKQMFNKFRKIREKGIKFTFVSQNWKIEYNSQTKKNPPLN